MPDPRFAEFQKAMAQSGAQIPPELLQQQLANTQAYADQYGRAAEGYRGLQHGLWRGYHDLARSGLRTQKREDRRRRKYGALSAALGGAGGIASALLAQPTQTPQEYGTSAAQAAGQTAMGWTPW